ncbi:DUF2798 domain-containing protein [Enterococcus phoeniculicola]|uniref:Integral membrane protein n=1 Tax=Enterococcus phoeniculicola ATCC BAA-412 TaxID=1158610 RepID=R3W4C2_9ENTE|nr:DUF2798 domain-containing protein [Enterococcus phoeniculicola]EOL42457.1 hypothetical protein UC3_02809 [Enterococcus phoeniculicola ATCC BAA-412]EOT79264.1 hypothetical protein I589_00772 [Enterococcus phoeniculicola ATCC BAA-412]
MPKSKKESLLLTSVMCFLMVLGMSTYNLILHDSFSWTSLVTGLIPGIVVAFILDVFIVGKIAKAIAFKLPISKEKMIYMILTISTLMVTGMVLCMSLFGILIEGGIQENMGALYIKAVAFNFIVALPLQLLIVGPISRFVLGTYQKSQLVEL